ncbi:Rid family hydrolase [Lysobacter sp. CFH 32150]|uniref:RidA family protein n=1 Tax=Lysobacter sp. CFH 32150 TaxID=2927128 RepID=UPI001FA6D406|nr:Rid family hydrolase [Lysobacter sp. CFH 32150]MCI4568750.1 RidA family protein [Lysobacter sp. CFH 32150]
MKTLCVALLMSLASGLAYAADNDVRKQAFHFAPVIEADLGFSRAIRVGNTLYISGSVGAGEMPAAIKQVYGRIDKTLAAHGLTFQNVVKETLFTTDLVEFNKHKELRKQYYAGDYPTSSWVEVSRLNSPELVLEVEAIAIFPEEDRAAK